MLHFPTTIHDNFLPDPQGVIALSERGTYKPCPYGRWPGTRSQPLIEFDQEFFTHFLTRYFLQFYDHDYLMSDKFHCSAISYFQKIPPNLDMGWVHSDHPFIISLILYLTPDADPRSGTAFYRPKSFETIVSNESKKKDYYLGKIEKEESVPYRKAHNSGFVQTGFIGNQFNRLLAFDSQLWHGVQDFDTGENERLTMITFIDTVVAKSYPISRSRYFPLFRNREDVPI
jgi:hypothetical protein